MHFTEDMFEQAVIELFENMGYIHIYAPDMERDYSSPLLDSVLMDSLVKLNKGLPLEAITEAVAKLRNFDTGSLLQKNMQFMDYLQNGLPVKYFHKGEERNSIVYLVDYKNVKNNEFYEFNKDLKFILPPDFIFSREEDDEGNEHVKIQAGEYENDDGETAYRFSCSIAESEIEYDEDAERFSPEDLLKKIAADKERVKYLMLPGKPASMLMTMGLPTRVFEKLTDAEKENLRGQLGRLSTVVERFDTMIEPEEQKTETEVSVVAEPVVSVVKKAVIEAPGKPRFFIGKRHIEEPIVFCVNAGKEITTLGMTIEFEAVAVGSQSNTVAFRAFFINQANEMVSDVKEICCTVGNRQKVTFTLNPKTSAGKECYLAVQSINDNVDELQQMIPFKVNIAFSSDFDF